jgi:transcriptional regulator GlxA family with amidase domain
LNDGKRSPFRLHLAHFAPYRIVSPFFALRPTGAKPMHQKRVGIVIFPNVEVLDFCGPYEVFSVTRLDETQRRETTSPFEILLVAQTLEPVVATSGMRTLPDCTLDECPPLDILVIPGGWGVRAELSNETLLAWIAERGAGVETLASVCTGSLLLGKLGFLDGRRATTHWQVLDWMRDLFPNVTVETDFHVVEDGRIVTSAGISAGIDMALRLVVRHCGEATARATARYMEYPFPENNARRI